MTTGCLLWGPAGLGLPRVLGATSTHQRLRLQHVQRPIRKSSWQVSSPVAAVMVRVHVHVRVRMR
eukprot:10575593-Alexandrium_andersonii.AAC.1